MALVAKSIGWRTNEENGVDEYIITLEAQTEADVPNLTFNDIIKNVPLRLTRQEALATSPEVQKLIREAEARVRDHAAQIGGDAAVEVLLRHEPDASPLKIQMTRQAIANPIRRSSNGAAK